MSMEDTATAARAVGRIHGLAMVNRWSLWTQRPTFIAYCLVVEAAALAATLITAVAVPAQPRDLAMLAGLAVLGVGQAELGRQIERMRRQVSDTPRTPHINVTSVWTFAGVLVLPPALTAVLVAVLYAHLQGRSWYRLSRARPFRTVFNASLAIVTCYSAKGLLAWGGLSGIRAALDHGWAGVGGIALAAITYFVVAAFIALPGLNPERRNLHELFGGWIDNGLEIVTLCLAVLTALALTTKPILALLVVPPVLLLHRVVLIKQLEVAASKDRKTGLFNLEGWHALATEALEKTGRNAGVSVGVLMVDLDRFQRINDTYGHPAGDAVLKAVAETITAQVRTFDAVGRFGGEEFAVLLPGITKDNAIRVAEQVRYEIARLSIDVTIDGRPAKITDLSASIGVAMAPAGGTAVDKLIYIADTARYVAKVTGSNKVVSLPDTA